MSVQLRKLTSLSFGIIPFAIKNISVGSQLYKAASLKIQFWAENRPLNIKTILIVDDQADLLISMSSKIEKKLGVRTIRINPGSDLPIRDQVLSLVESHSPDMIIMDGNLGKSPAGEKQTGTEIIKELRSRGYKGYIVANSNDPVLNWDMKNNGADFSARDRFTKYNKLKQLTLFISKYFQGGQ
jgi:CheY-like chemotaxis protein